MAVKLCGKCKLPKDSKKDFYRNRSKKDGLSNFCKECNGKHGRSWYAANRTSHLKHVAANNRVKWFDRASFIYEYLIAHPCVDCGEADPLVLDFDHVRGRKVGHVSLMAKGGWSLRKVHAEIEKCEVRCANCHRRKTAMERGSVRWYLSQVMVTKLSGRATAC